MSKVEEMVATINANKEILEALPKNNKKNIANYEIKIKDLQKEIYTYEKEILEEIEKRFNKLANIKENKNIDSMRKEINNTESILYLLNDIETSYEKMDLDRAIQNLSYYYKKNLEVVNNSILFIIKKFEEVGISLKEEDFCYSNYVKEYINLFFEELKTENVNSSKIQDKFDEIYWKCPDIITHIELNIRYLYLKNEKEIDKYYTKKKLALLKNFTAQDIYNRFLELKKQLLKEEKQDKRAIIDEFINGNLNVKNYSKANIKSNYEKLLVPELLEDKKKLNEIDDNIEKLSNSIYEYKNYLKYKYIVDDIKEIYEQKDKYKNIYNDTKKEISKKEQKLLKLNKKINSKGIFKKQTESSITEQNNLILEIKQLYKDLDKNKVYNKIFIELNDNSTIAQILNFASCFYKYLYECNKKNFKSIDEEQIQDNIYEFLEFVKWPYCTLLNNVEINDNKDLLLIIKDRYQLLNINIAKEDLEQSNIENLTQIVNNIEMAHSIRKNNIDIEEIENMCEFKKILNK